MILEEKKITLKNGKTAIFATPNINDAEKMLNHIKQCCAETEYLTRYPEEWTIGVEQEVEWINSMRTATDALTFTCFVDGEVAGNCEIRFRSGIKTSHRATVGISIVKKYWNLGIGTAMFEEMIALARQRGIEILELEFIEGNERAKHLYEKFGFRIVAERPNAFKLKDGTYLKEFFMQKNL